MSINIENEYQGLLDGFLTEKECRELAERVANAALDHEGCPYEAEVGLLITDDESIRELNSRFRGIDKSTDVLSFPMTEYESPACFDGFDERTGLFNPESGELLLGDIAISADHVVSQALEYGHSVEREFSFLVAHSMLHLMGYDHMEEEERIDMEKRQEDILSGLDITR